MFIKAFVALLLLPAGGTVAQGLPQKLAKSFTAFLADAQLAHASASLYVIDAATGELVYNHNGQLALAPASTQKVITSVTALELLGPDYRFRTDWAYTGQVKNGKLTGNIIIKGSGDPSLGSWRYPGSTEDVITKQMSDALKDRGINDLDGIVYADDHRWESATVPGGWIWDDLGNYYGAGASALNWRENQYDLYFNAAPAIGGTPVLVRTVPGLYQVRLINELTTAAKGTGDRSYIYLPPYSPTGYIRGTLPMENNFRISGSFPDPALQSAHVFTEVLKAAGYNPGTPETYHGWSGDKSLAMAASTNFYTHYSPTLDSLVYWLNKKSINLYAEAMLKTLSAAGGTASSVTQASTASTARGIEVLKAFWKTKGIDPDELDMADGSGLSPQDKVTTHAQVMVLKYAYSRPWYRSFLNSLPEYNNMTMKSGTISKVKGFAGYHTSRAGRTYIFSILVNNYQGSSSSLVTKMYKVLDMLK